ncbi:MAG TPA: type II secretion system protein GspC [Kofleriaceae bacterium]|jgi:general secretion pathway protein C|nr:type II secretion system protein GspC [Kofleriaceae bacterium]
MQDLIKRYFWVLGGIAVMVCAVFAAKATNHVIEAKYLRDPDHAPKLAVVVPTTVTPVKQSRSKDGTPFALRDMFCSECTPTVSSSTSTDSSSVQETSLPLSLLATNVGLEDDDSYATIINTSNQHQGAYSIGDPIPGATGKVTEIHYKYIEFENSNHIERLSLAGATPPPVVAQATPAEGSGSGDDMQAMIDSGIKKIDDNHYEISKDLVDRVLLNPMGFTKGARVVPAMANGKPNGFKLYSIRPGSVYAKLGLENGDTLSAINGMDLTSAEKALEVYTKLRDATTLEVGLTRRNKPDTITYSIR